MHDEIFNVLIELNNQCFELLLFKIVSFSRIHRELRFMMFFYVTHFLVKRERGKNVKISVCDNYRILMALHTLILW